MLSTIPLTLLLLSFDFAGFQVHALTSYPSEFVNPADLVNSNFAEITSTSDAQLTITGFARDVQDVTPWGE